MTPSGKINVVGKSSEIEVQRALLKQFSKAKASAVQSRKKASKKK